MNPAWGHPCGTAVESHAQAPVHARSPISTSTFGTMNASGRGPRCNGVATRQHLPAVGGSWSKQRNTPADLAEDRGAADHLTERWL